METPMPANGKSNGTSDSPRIDKLILYYLQTSDTIKAIEARHKQELAKSKKFLEKLSYLLLEALDNSGQDSAKTKKGTVSAIVRDTASLSDASKFMDFVRDNDAYELMD